MNFVIKLTQKQLDAFLDFYKDALVSSNDQHVLARFKKEGVVITVYTTGSVMFQGKDAEHEVLFWEDTFKLPKRFVEEQPAMPFYFPSIGSDESGSGDYFGPLTACAVAIYKEDVAFLKQFKIQDSKTLSDDLIREIAPQLVKRLKYSLNILDNETYNRLVEEGYNLNKLKAFLHAQCHKTLLRKINEELPIVIDQFCEPTLYKRYLSTFHQPPIPDYFYTKAESRFASVAVASIIARYVFLERLSTLGKPYNVMLHKGASSKVDEQARSLVEQHGEKVLNKVAKTHFKNTQKVLDK